MLIRRRAFLIAASLAAAPIPARAQGYARGMFTHGVASGDPLADGVIIWSRFVGPDGGRIGWEVAEDETFARVAARGDAEPRLSNDFCVKADVRGLSPGRRYFYRFLSASGPSVTGQTRTAPRAGAGALKVALFSCANFAYGYFHAYGHAAARDDIDLVLHAGDYIYEVQRGAYPNAENAVPGRVIDPAHETVTLADYCQRYATYHTDTDLLELRRLKPISAIWDDHEIANDTWRDGAQAHHTPTEGAFPDRIAAASKAFFDWMPIRRPEQTGARIYRALDWGNVARILLLDTRYIGRDRQIDYRTTLGGRLTEAGANANALVTEFRATLLDDPNRSMLGAAQEDWLSRTLADSKARGQTWQVIAQQVVMGDQIAPPDIARLFGNDVSPGSRAWFTTAAQVTALGLPWNLDAWGGYPAARARFLHACTTHAANAIVLGGDSHNCWLNNLAAAGGNRLAAIEFAGGSVSSPGFERSLTRAAPGEREAMMRSANPHLAFTDLSHRGYGTLTFTRDACEAEWLAFDDVRSAIATEPRVTRMASSASAGSGPGAWTQG